MEVIKSVTAHAAHAIRDRPIEMCVLFQPIFNMNSLQVMGYEAFTRVFAGGKPVSTVSLLRWAKNEGLLGQMEQRMCRAILEEGRQLIADGQLLFVNLEAASFLDFLDGAGSEVFNGHAQGVVLEITEHDLTRDSGRMKEVAVRWRELGVRLAVDDMVSGHDRLRHLLHLAPEFIKLNRELVCDCDKEPRHRAMALGLAEMGKTMGASTIAEGVETAKEMQVLKNLGVPAGQGYYFCRPAPAEEFLNIKKKGGNYA